MKDRGSHPEPGSGSSPPGQAQEPCMLWLGEGRPLDPCQKLPALSLLPMGSRAKRDHSGEPSMVPAGLGTTGLCQGPGERPRELLHMQSVGHPPLS